MGQDIENANENAKSARGVSQKCEDFIKDGEKYRDTFVVGTTTGASLGGAYYVGSLGVAAGATAGASATGPLAPVGAYVGGTAGGMVGVAVGSALGAVVGYAAGTVVANTGQMTYAVQSGQCTLGDLGEIAKYTVGLKPKAPRVIE